MNDEEESEEISDATLERNDTMEMEEDGDEVSVSSKSSKSSEVSEVEQSSLAMISRYQVVQDHSFDEIQLPTATAEQIRLCWAAFFAKMPSREAAGEAIYDVLMEEAPGVAALFKSARSVFGLRFIEGLNSLVVEINEPAALKKQVETLGYQHLDYDVTTARVELVRDGILQVMEQEMGAQFTSFYRDSFSALLNYVGGAFMYIKRELAGHIKIIQRSWRLARKVMEEEAVHQQEEPDSPLSVPQVPSAPSEAATDEKVKAKEAKEETEEEKGAKDKNSLQVPTSFEGMFLFNAAVMGYGESSWMKIVLDHLDAIAVNVANTSRLQEECFVLTIHLSKVKDSVNLPEFKAVMLAALRSIVPDEWNMDHEMAWNWLWESVERIISSTISFPRAYEKTIRTFLFEQSEANMNQLRAQTYSCFFQRCPSGQDHFKQSTTRLYFILDRNYEMVLEIFENPAKVVEDLSALGLRHVGFGVPVEFFPPFVASAVEALNTLTTDEAISQAFTWSETLISKILMRVILEGSTIVMKAINLNEEAALRKAISVAPRGQRAQQLLNITAGTQSFSPLFWAIDSGSLNSAKAIIQDLLTIRADREVYYYGCEELFRRHPNIIKRLCTSAPTLLETLLDGLIWRSRVTSEGLRRVNYYIKHLIQDEEGNFAPAMDDVVQHADPKIASHPCMILATDMVWFKFATFYFLLSRGYFLFTLLVFASGQTILVRHQEMETQEERYVMLGCRLFLYMVVMPAMLANFVMLCMRDVHSRHMSRLCGLPIPASLKEFDKALRLCLLWVMVFLSCTEPMLWCMNSGSQELAFLTDCPEISTEMKTIYGILSAFGMLLFWLLLSDFSVFSTRISAFLLVCSHVISEVGLFMMALAVLLIAFATSVNALNHHLEDFDGVHVWLRALFQIVLGMFPVSNYDRFQDEAAVMAFVSVFIILVFIFLLNLLVAQLNQSYHLKFCDMKGNARLRRARVICSVMASSAPAKHWRRFLDSLGFEQRLEFNEGDIGIAGGLQVLEPASAITVTFDAVKRYGGSTAPTMPWPPEVEVADMEQDRYERLEKLLLKGIHRHGKSHGNKNSMLGSSSLMSDDISDSNNGSH